MDSMETQVMATSVTQAEITRYEQNSRVRYVFLWVQLTNENIASTTNKNYTTKLFKQIFPKLRTVCNLLDQK